MRALRTLRRQSRSGTRFVRELLDLFSSALTSPVVERRRGWAVFRDATVRQAGQLALRPAPVVAGLGLVLGATAALGWRQVPGAASGDVAHATGAHWTEALNLIWAIAPAAAAVALLALAIAPMVTQLRDMRAHREVDTLHAMGINVDYVVVLPRLLALAGAAVALTVVLLVVAVAACLAAVAVFSGGEGLVDAGRGWLEGVTASAAWLPLIAGAVAAGLGAGTIGCHYGLAQPVSAASVHGSVRRAMTAGIVWVLAVQLVVVTVTTLLADAQAV